MNSLFALQKERIKYYNVEYLGHNPTTNIVELGGLEGSFSKYVSFPMNCGQRIIIFLICTF